MESGVSTSKFLAPRHAELDGLTLASLARSGRRAELLDAVLTRLEERHFLESAWSSRDLSLVGLIHACDVLLLGIGEDPESTLQVVADGVEAESHGVPSVVLVDEAHLVQARSQAHSRGLADLALVAVPGSLTEVGGAGGAAASPEFSRLVRDVEHAMCADPHHTASTTDTDEGGGVSCLC